MEKKNRPPRIADKKNAFGRLDGPFERERY